MAQRKQMSFEPEVPHALVSAPAECKSLRSMPCAAARAISTSGTGMSL